MRPQDIPDTDHGKLDAGDMVRANKAAQEERVFGNDQRASIAVITRSEDDGGIVRLMWHCDGFETTCHTDWLEKDEKLSNLSDKPL